MASPYEPHLNLSQHSQRNDRLPPIQTLQRLSPLHLPPLPIPIIHQLNRGFPQKHRNDRTELNLCEFLSKTAPHPCSEGNETAFLGAEEVCVGRGF